MAKLLLEHVAFLRCCVAICDEFYLCKEEQIREVRGWRSVKQRETGSETQQDIQWGTAEGRQIKDPEPYQQF